MDEIIQFLNNELDILVMNGKHKLTGEVRILSRNVYRRLSAYSFTDKLEFCKVLLETGKWANWIIAYDIAFKERKNYTIHTFDVFEDWLKKYVTNWGDCDDFCVHALGAIVYDYPELFERVITWCESSNFVVRRAAAVSLIYSIRRGSFDQQKAFMVSDKLMKDDHYLVLKGYGWMLKEFSTKDDQAVEAYLKEHVHEMPRLAFRYAVEKLSKDVKTELMKL